MKTKITLAIAAVIVTCLSFTFVNVSDNAISSSHAPEATELVHEASPVGGLLADEVVR